MSTDFNLFKDNLNKQGINWSDQQILDYISEQEDKKYTQPIMQSDLSEELFNVIQKWEYKDSARSQSHNNPGGHIWTPELEAEFGAKKGESFTGPNREGGQGQYWTAKYDSFEQGEKASLFVTNNVINNTISRTGLKPNDQGFGEAFAREYSGSADPQVVRNYGGDITRAVSKYTSTMPAPMSNPTDKVSQIDNFFDTGGVYKPPGYEEPRGAAADFIGNFLWNAADLTTFGALDYLDVDEVLWGKEYGQQPGQAGPQTFSGRVGAGLGGFAGFLTPFMATKTAVSMGIKGVSKYGANAVSRKLAKEGSEFLGKKAGVAGQGYKKFKNLPVSQQNKFMNDIYI